MEVEITSLTETRKVSAKPGFWKRWLRHWDLQVMVLPGILVLIVFSYFPMWGILTAFQDYDISLGFFESPWVGLKHFQMFFEDPSFWLIMRNTLMISLLRLLFAFPAPIILALLLNEVHSQGFKRVIQTVSYLPHFMSWVIISGLIMSLLSADNGSLNLALLQLNLVKEPVNWLSIPEYFWTILITTGVWKEIGFGAIVYLAAISGVDPSLYEAASMDGASRLQRIWHVTLPSIAPIVVIFLILNVGQILNAGFEDILLLTNRGNNAILRDVSDVIDTYVYRVGLVDYRYSYGVAVGVFKSTINVTLLWFANMLARRVGGASLW